MNTKAKENSDIIEQLESLIRNISEEEIEEIRNYLKLLSKGNPDTDTESGLHLADVSGLLPADTPTYTEWIDKYFTWYRNDDLYKDKRSGKVYYQLELFNRYKKAYKGNNR